VSDSFIFDIFAMLLTILLGGLVLAISLFYSRLRFSMRKGKFTVAKNNAEFFSFGSDFGSFHFNFKQQILFASLAKDKKTISLQEVIGMRYVVDDELALYTERFSLKGSADFNNVIHWYTIKLILHDRTEISLFIAGEFEPVNWFAEWQNRLEIGLFTKLGLVADVDAHCRKVLDLLQTSFKNAGHELSLI
jgi:hypothetical protein